MRQKSARITPAHLAHLCFSGVVIFLLIGKLEAQSGGAQVLSDHASVYTRMSTGSDLAATLEKGNPVTVRMSISADAGCWLDIAWGSKPVRTGFVRCEEIRQAAATSRIASPVTALPKYDRVDQLLVLAGVTRSIQNVTDSSNLRFLWNTMRIDETDAEVRRVFENALRADVFYSAIRGRFLPVSSDPRIPVLIARLSDPVVQDAIALEAQASAPQFQAEKVQYMARLQSAPAGSARQRLVERIQRASGEPENSVEVVISEIRGAVRARNEPLPAYRQVSPEDLEKAVTEARAKGTKELARKLRDAALYAYSSLSDAQLERYAGFLESSDAQWLTGLIQQGVLSATENFAYQVFTGLGRISKSISPPLDNPSQALSAQELYEQGVRLVDAGNYLEAIRYLDAALQLKPDYAIAYYKRGNAYRELDLTSKSMNDYTQAIRFDPSMTLAYINRGFAFKALRQWNHALEDFTSAIQSNPEALAGWFDRALLYNDLGQDSRALQDYNRAIQLAPANWNLYGNRGMTYRRLDDFSHSLQDCETAARLNPKYSEAHWCVATALGALRDYPRALTAYNRAIELSPQNADIYESRAWVFERLGRFDSALEDYSAAIRLNPRDAGAHCKRARILQGQGRDATTDAGYCSAQTK